MKYGFGLVLVCIVTVAGLAMRRLGIDPVRPFRSADVIVRQETVSPPATSSHAKRASKPSISGITKTRAVIETCPNPRRVDGRPDHCGRTDSPRHPERDSRENWTESQCCPLLQ